VRSLKRTSPALPFSFAVPICFGAIVSILILIVLHLYMDCLGVLQMAPKNQPRVGSKRQKPSSSGTLDRLIPPPRTFDRTRFSSGKHFQRFTQFGKGTWHEKVFDIRPIGQYAHILEMITSQGWSKLLTPETRINPDIVKEFYANVMPLCETHDMVT